MEQSETKNPVDEYRKTLVEIEQNIGAGFDKTLITLSGGALGLTITFIKDIVKKPEPQSLELALYSWSAWAISLSSLLLAFYLGTLAYRTAIRNWDSGKLDPKNPGGKFSTITRFLNFVGVVAFIFGVVQFVRFTYLNLGG